MKKTRYSVFIRCADVKKNVGNFDDLDAAKKFADKKAAKEPVGSGCYYTVEDNYSSGFDKKKYEAF